MAMAEKKGMSAKKQLIALIVVAVVGFVLLLIYQRPILEDTWDTLRDADLRYVLLLPLIQIVNYYFIGTYYRKMFALFDAKITVARSWGVVAAMNFVNQVLPSGGLSGITYLAYGFRAKIATGKTTLVQIGRYLAAFAGYFMLAPLAFAAVVLGGRSDQLNDLASDAGSNVGVFVVLILFVIIMGLGVASLVNDKVAHVTGRAFLKSVNWINRNILRRKNEIVMEPLKKVNREFHVGAKLVKEMGWKAVYPSLFMVISTVLEVIIVYVSLLAVGGDVGIGPVFLAFVAANIVGVVSVIPGDVGVHEATVILVLVGFGVDEPVAISTTLLYRVFNKFIFLPIGFYFYANILKPAVEAGKK